MTENSTAPAINLLLSRDELLYVLNLLEVGSIPGLDADPDGVLTTEQRLLVFNVAGRALRARRLAQVNGSSTVKLHQDLLKAVGICAYAQSAIFVYHWPPNSETMTRFFGHIRGDDVVVHTRPDDVLHLFTCLSSKQQLLEQVFTTCAFADTPDQSSQEFTLASALFVQVRELATGGGAKRAIDLLVNQQIGRESAIAFVQTLATAPRISILQTMKQQNNQTVRRRDFTLVQNPEQTWLLLPVGNTSSQAPLLARVTNRGEVETLLKEWI